MDTERAPVGPPSLGGRECVEDVIHMDMAFGLFYVSRPISRSHSASMVHVLQLALQRGLGERETTAVQHSRNSSLAGHPISVQNSTMTDYSVASTTTGSWNFHGELNQQPGAQR